MSQTIFGWFRNKFQTPGAPSFTPTVNIEETLAANGLQYTATITSNLPSTTLDFDLIGNVTTAEVSNQPLTGNITTDSGGNATLVRNANVAITSDLHTFQTHIQNPFTSSNLAIGNTITLSGTINKNIQLARSGNQGTVSNVTIANVEYTLYSFTDPGNTAITMTVLADSEDFSTFAVGGGGGGGGFHNPSQNNSGGGGSGGTMVAANITINNASVFHANVGAGGSAGAHGVFAFQGGDSLVGTSSNSIQYLKGTGGRPGSNGNFSSPNFFGGNGGIGYSGGGGGSGSSGGGTGGAFANDGGGGGDPVGTLVGVATGNVNGQSANVSTGGDGGSDYTYDITGSNVSYSGGGGGGGSGALAANGDPGGSGPGSGGSTRSDLGTLSATPGANGIIIVRHIRNGDRAFSM